MREYFETSRIARKTSQLPQIMFIKEDGDPALKLLFFSHLVEDRQDSAHSYHQFLGLLKEKLVEEKY